MDKNPTKPLALAVIVKVYHTDMEILAIYTDRCPITYLVSPRPNVISTNIDPGSFFAMAGAPIRKTPHLLFCAFSCFFYFFHKKVEKAQKSQVLHLPECFLRQSKKYIAFKSILGQKSTAKKLQVVIKWK